MQSATKISEAAFSEQQYQSSYPSGIENSFWQRARNTVILDWLTSSGMANETLLEIGCGRGIIVDFLRKSGVNCIGCDIAKAPVPVDLAQFVFAGTDFRQLPVDLKRGIKGVLLCDVIEHIAEKGSLLGSLPAEFPDLTHVLITVPARPELWSAWDEHYGHFRRYDLKTLQQEVEQAGFALVRRRYFFSALYPPMRLLRSRRRTSIKAPSRLSLHRLMASLLVVESRLMPSWLPGTSIIAVCSPKRRCCNDARKIVT